MRQILTSKAGKAILVVAALLLLTGTVLAGGGGLYISKYVIGGGGDHSEMGRFVMDATVGQAMVGTFTNTAYGLCAGFWCGMGEYRVYLPVVLRN